MSQTARAYNPWHGLLHAVAERLIPLFQIEGQTIEYARRAAREAIAAYRAESRADYVSIGRILALSFATMAAIAKSADPDLPPDQQLRLFTKANSLSRSADEAERGMTKRRQRREGRPEPDDGLLAPPAAETPAPETQAARTPAPGISQPALPEPADAAIFAQIDAAMADFRAVLADGQRPPFAARPPVPPRQSFRQTLKNHATIGVARSLARAPASESVMTGGGPAGGLKHAIRHEVKAG